MWYNAKLTESVHHLDSTQKEALSKLSELEERVKEMKEQKPSPPLTLKKEDRGTQMTPDINEQVKIFTYCVAGNFLEGKILANLAF